MCSGASKCNDICIYKISVINTTAGYTFHYFKNIKSKVMPSHAKSLLTEDALKFPGNNKMEMNFYSFQAWF